MVSVYGDTTPFNRTIFTLGSCSKILGARVVSFEGESEMLMARKKYFIEVDPGLVIGYNITQFDALYLLNRAKRLGLDDFPFLARDNASSQVVPPLQPGQNQLHFTECPGFDGRLILDVFYHIKVNHPPKKMETGALKLDSVAAHFLRDQKEGVHFTQILVLQKGNADTRGKLAAYFLKDIYLPLLLLKRLECFENEVQQTKKANVPYDTLRLWSSLKSL